MGVVGRGFAKARQQSSCRLTAASAVGAAIPGRETEAVVELVATDFRAARCGHSRRRCREQLLKIEVIEIGGQRPSGNGHC